MPAPHVRSLPLSQYGVRHAFFGREGGRSTGDFASNNMSVSVGDAEYLVAENRAAAVEMLGYRRRDLMLVKQTHSTNVLTIIERPNPETVTEADAMVTDRSDVVLGILTADCSPVLLTDPEAGIVGAAHAGWKGAAGGILERTVAAMAELGADPGRIHAAIGPTISGPNYEVGPDTARDILALDPEAASHISIPAGKTREHYDIPGHLSAQLASFGLARIDNLGLCTYADPARFFSHRYATHHGTGTGRQIALIGLA
jgi:YfiH family protein